LGSRKCPVYDLLKDDNISDDSFPNSSMPPEVLEMVLSATKAVGLEAMADAGLAYSKFLYVIMRQD